MRQTLLHHLLYLLVYFSYFTYITFSLSLCFVFGCVRPSPSCPYAFKPLYLSPSLYQYMTF